MSPPHSWSDVLLLTPALLPRVFNKVIHLILNLAIYLAVATLLDERIACACVINVLVASEVVSSRSTIASKDKVACLKCWRRILYVESVLGQYSIIPSFSFSCPGWIWSGGVFNLCHGSRHDFFSAVRLGFWSPRADVLARDWIFCATAVADSQI